MHILIGIITFIVLSVVTALWIKNKTKMKSSDPETIGFWIVFAMLIVIFSAIWPITWSLIIAGVVIYFIVNYAQRFIDKRKNKENKDV